MVSMGSRRGTKGNKNIECMGAIPVSWDGPPSCLFLLFHGDFLDYEKATQPPVFWCYMAHWPSWSLDRLWNNPCCSLFASSHFCPTSAEQSPFLFQLIERSLSLQYQWWCLLQSLTSTQPSCYTDDGINCAVGDRASCRGTIRSAIKAKIHRILNLPGSEALQSRVNWPTIW